jgi:hypothetical protein
MLHIHACLAPAALQKQYTVFHEAAPAAANPEASSRNEDYPDIRMPIPEFRQAPNLK